MWRLSATASGESVAEGTLTGPYWPRYPIIGSLNARLSLGVGCHSDETWQDIVWPDGSRMRKVQYGFSVAIASGESVDEGTLTGPYWPRYPIIGA
ncbi:hypothetical protein DPMN_007054 [Dreissena polymorpha]|uniref:Uncharacterized protein n=1 Tax=Dreissena polymorpha TaxID=45954 RepID=A0A9D4MWM6_DREPO|nr:hypothetical protein DPMN_007054 [Dreissena polymorpha]